ncbi:MAG: 50S ribosomal protein L18 [Acidobacteria bacterium]|nr:50S ribosomal protein L18 [Acidobacteriota bacterium]
MNHRHFSSNERRLWRKTRIRKKLFGTAEIPRVCVFKSNKFLYLQAVDDIEGKTLASASSKEKDFEKEKSQAKKNLKIAEKLGALISERLKEKGINKIVFDRSGYLYHGKIKAVADSIRKSGLLN